MNQVEVVKKVAENYRHNPTIDATLSFQLRGELKGIIGCVASQAHLQQTLSDMRSQGYKESGNAYKNFLGRLAAVEHQLKQYEGIYGKLTALQYLT